MLEFPMSQKNPYQLAFGPSNSEGNIRVTADQIRKEALKVNQLFVMDYAPLEAFWTGTIRIVPLNREALQRALSAARLFRRYEYPPGYQDLLLAAAAILSKSAGTKLSATVQCDTGEPITIDAASVDV